MKRTHSDADNIHFIILRHDRAYINCYYLVTDSTESGNREIHHQSTVYVVRSINIYRSKHDRHTARSSYPFGNGTTVKMNHTSVVKIGCRDDQGESGVLPDSLLLHWYEGNL